MMLPSPLFKRGVTLFSCLLTFCFFQVFATSTNDKDPFQSLGIPDLNPKQLLAELDNASKKDKDSHSNSLPQLKSIEDLPNFLKNSKLNEDEAISILTRFLIQDDFTLKKFGVVYDQSGFDGIINSGERIAPVGTEERLMQRARSSANIWFKEKYPKLDYDAYGAENQLDEIVPNWRSYKVLMIGKNGENTFVKICLPLDESETALCSDKDEPCGPKAEYVEKEKKKNEDYISRIKSGNFFQKKPKISIVKLLPGEEIKGKDKDKSIVLNSSTIKYKVGDNLLFNPPSLDAANADPLLNAYQNKSARPMGNNVSPYNFSAIPGAPNQPMQFMTNMLGMSMQGSLPVNVNMFNQPFQAGYPQMRVGINPIVSPSSQNLILPNGIDQAYNFKEKESTRQVNDNPPAKSTPPIIDNTQLMNELMQMKAQINQVMSSLRQKDEIINQQNIKIAQLTNMRYPGLGVTLPQLQFPAGINPVIPPIGTTQGHNTNFLSLPR